MHRRIQYFYALQNDHHSMSNYVLSSCKVKQYFFLSWELLRFPLNSIICNIIKYSHHAVHYTPVTYLLQNWKFLSRCLSPILPTPSPTLWQPSIFPLYLWVLFSLFICFVDSTYKWNYMVFVFLWVISLSIILSRSIHVAANGKISFFFTAGWYSIVFITHPFHPSIDGHLSWLL